MLKTLCVDCSVYIDHLVLCRPTLTIPSILAAL